MTDFSRITVVSIDGRGGELMGAQCAIRQSMNQLPGARGLLLSPHRPEHLLPDVAHQSVAPFGYMDYSLFVTYVLHHFIQSEFALIVQEDGWVLNGSNWCDDYFNYDYIGAPTHFARLTSPAGAQYFRNYRWTQFYKSRSDSVALDVVMNGGFSLRSRKLLNAPQTLGLDYILPPPHLHSPENSMRWDSDAHMEDVQLSIHMKRTLCDAGIRFADYELAKQFSIEHLDPVFHQGAELGKLFGHHAKLRKIVSLSPLTVAYQLREDQLNAIPGEAVFAEALRQLGYHVVFQ